MGKKKTKAMLQKERKRQVEYNKRRYATDSEFRAQKLACGKAWREKNREYDILRKKIDFYTLSPKQRKRRNATQKAWLGSLDAERRASLYEKVKKQAAAWAKKQYNDPEIGPLWKIFTSKSKGVTARMKAKAKRQYNAIMERRKLERRMARIHSLMDACNPDLRQRAISRLLSVDLTRPNKI